MKLIKVNGNTVATAVKTKSGVFNMQLGINEYSDESLDRFIKYLKVYGTVEVVSDGLENVPDKHQMQDNLNKAALEWGEKIGLKYIIDLLTEYTEITEDPRYRIAQSLKMTGGFCPCKIGKLPENKCPCIDMKENNVCICGLYV